MTKAQKTYQRKRLNFMIDLIIYSIYFFNYRNIINLHF